jgi:histidyl-tRNA synthetase
VGTKSLVVEAELCAAADDALTKLGFTDFTLRLNHRAALTAMLEWAGLPAQQQETTLIVLDKLDKIGPAGVTQELADRGVDVGAATKYLEFLQDIKEADEVDRLGRTLTLLAAHDIGRKAISDLIEIVRLLEQTPATGRLRFDPSLARGLSYYTGAIMEINVPDLAGSLGGGGRYDNLIGMFLGRDVPACGFSLGLERILVVMAERNMFPESVVGAPSDVMVTLWNEGTCAAALALAATLRAGGLRVDVYPEADKIGKQFKYASTRHVPFVTVVGDDEQARGEVTIKDMRSGEQKSVRPDEVSVFIKRALGR